MLYPGFRTFSESTCMYLIYLGPLPIPPGVKGRSVLARTGSSHNRRSLRWWHPRKYLADGIFTYEFLRLLNFWHSLSRDTCSRLPSALGDMRGGGEFHPGGPACETRILAVAASPDDGGGGVGFRNICLRHSSGNNMRLSLPPEDPFPLPRSPVLCNIIPNGECKCSLKEFLL